jgi:hypothetical protein
MADSTAAASNTKPSASNSESTKKPNRRPRYRKNNKPRVNDKKPQADKKKEEGEEETPEESGSDGEEGEACFICTEPVDYYSVAPCNHRTCHMCTLRLRVLYKTKNCAYCKVSLFFFFFFFLLSLEVYIFN